MYFSIYTDERPALISQLADTPAMKRLLDIGMHCGCDYTKNVAYQQARGTYSRYIHSIGVAEIIWNFTRDMKQAIAGLFHDIASPVFAHTVDFLNGDHITQESTESKTRYFIEKSPEIMSLLAMHNIKVEEIEDYHNYPLADNDTPMLSADRLEYTLGDAYFVQKKELSAVKKIYEDLTVGENEVGTEELCFRSPELAKEFTRISLVNSRQFVSNENRFAMQYLADLLKEAWKKNVIQEEDLYSIESSIIKKLKENQYTRRLWDEYRKTAVITESEVRLEDRYCINVAAKKRYINPLVLVGGVPKRVADVDVNIRIEMNAFLSRNFDKWLYIPQ